MSVEWKCLVKDQHSSPLTRKCLRFPVTDHPLKPSTIKVVSQRSEPSTDLFDPLSSVLEGNDPLSAFARESVENHIISDVVEKSPGINWLDTWKSRRVQILNKYTTVEKLSIMSSYLPGGEKVSVKSHTSMNEQVKHRLEQLDQFEEGSVRHTMGLSQQEYVTKIDMLNSELVQAWNTQQRVKALKIAIQCSKLLVDTNVIQFYPSKFILITDILDTFGTVVYNRLRSKAVPGHQGKYPEDIDPDTVPESAKETCQNWLYKMSSIRELVPRVYIEMSLLRCYTFLSRNDFDSAVMRLTKMIRGIGNPLVALYARCYLCRVALNLNTTNKDYFKANLDDFLLTHSQISTAGMRAVSEQQGVVREVYLCLYLPALDWLMYGALSFTPHPSTLIQQLLERCQTIQPNELVLHSIITQSLDCQSIAEGVDTIIDLIGQSESESMKGDMLRLVGERMCAAGGGGGEGAVQGAWRVAMSMRSLHNFLAVAEPWMHFASLHLSIKHINILLRQIVKYVTKSEDSLDEHYLLVQSLMKKMLNNVEDFEDLFIIDAFVPLIDLIQSTPARVEICKTLMTNYQQRQHSTITDALLIGNLMRLCRTLHDSINALTVEDEIKILSDVISKYVQSVSFDSDFEQQLSFYVDCRAAFINLDAVQIVLIHSVNTLSSKARLVQGEWRALRAHAAYCYITAPSLACPLQRAQLYLLSGQVALLNRCLGQAEACFKASISLIPEIPPKKMMDGQMRSTNSQLYSLLSSFLSTLLIVPDSVDASCILYLLKGYLKAVQRSPWDRTDFLYYSILLKALHLLCNLAQQNYIYHIDGVISNDLLYGSDRTFLDEVDKMCSLIVEELLGILKQLQVKTGSRSGEVGLALELFWCLVRRADLTDAHVETLATNLWLLAHKHQHDLDAKLCKKMLTTLVRETEKNGVYDVILPKLKIRP